MTGPAPEAGLVVCYSYLWSEEASVGRDEGRKDRPCVIVLAVEQLGAGVMVTVLPITHREPREAGAAVEIPHAVKRHLGLDDERSWIVVTEGDQFVWPGYDLRPARGGDGYTYGFLPPRLFQTVVGALRAWHRARSVTVTTRT